MKMLTFPRENINPLAGGWKACLPSRAPSRCVWER